MQLEMSVILSFAGDIFYFIVLPFVGGSHDVLFQWDYNDGSYYTSQDFSHPYVYSAAGEETSFVT